MDDAYLTEAIGQHPQLWESMGRAWVVAQKVPYDDHAQGWLGGMVAALCIVGGFDTGLVEGRLRQDFG